MYEFFMNTPFLLCTKINLKIMKKAQKYKK